MSGKRHCTGDVFLGKEGALGSPSVGEEYCYSSEFEELITRGIWLVSNVALVFTKCFD